MEGGSVRGTKLGRGGAGRVKQRGSRGVKKAHGLILRDVPAKGGRERGFWFAKRVRALVRVLRRRRRRVDDDGRCWPLERGCRAR